MSYDGIQLCPDLAPKQICFVLQRYHDGVFDRIVHEHIPAHRIASSNRACLLRSLVIAGTRRSDDELASIIGFFVNKRGRDPVNRPLPVNCSYPEPGVLRTYCGTNVAAWSDEVVAPDQFRQPVELQP